MKYINKLSALAFAALAMTSCQDLNTELYDKYVTTDEKEAVLERNPEMAMAGVAGISSSFSTYMTVYSNHFDFGYPGVMIGLDLQGNDVVCPAVGYNWYQYWSAFRSPSPTGTPSGMAWYHIYDQIFAANALVATISPDTEDGTLMFSRAQGVGYRAFDYFVLAQLYQFNYQINPDAPCVPLVLDTNTAEIEENGAPRATVREVYEQVLTDLNEAIQLLTATSVTPEEFMDSKPKRLISLAVAYGLRARVYLTMGEYQKAAADAQAAIDNFSGSPYTIKQVSTPTFQSIDDNSWMWGIAIAETDRVVTSGIVNWPSMFVTFSEGYVNVGAWKYCASDLYAAIPGTDVRKGWFLDDNLESNHLTPAQQAYLNSYQDTLEPYTNVKFGSYQNINGQSTNANDIVMMRVEEMYYIKAEAEARAGNGAAAKDEFVKFVQTYRNPNYMISATDNEGIAEAIYQDKRVEFWGEGISYFDVMRLNKNIERIGKNWYPAESFDIPSIVNDPSATKAGVLIYCIPQGEINGNPAISASDNNATCTRPAPGQTL